MSEPNIAGAIPVVVTGNRVERLASLFDAHHERLYRLARRLTASPDDALDLVQETFLKAVRTPKSVPLGSADEEAWLVRVLINIRRDQWRKASIRDRYDKQSVERDIFRAAPKDPEAQLIARTAVWHAFSVLPPRRRAIVIMHELDGLAVPAIASLLGISAITVRWHLSAGRRNLIRALRTDVGETI
jgi:RNA polymerase sigma-70 factor (ECF subfamily)